VRKVWRQLQREGHGVARCRVARLMKKVALQGMIRGGRVRTTVSDRATPGPLDHGNREFRTPTSERAVQRGKGSSTSHSSSTRRGD